MARTRTIYDRIRESNEWEIESRKDLPDLLEALHRWKSGDKETLERFFYHEASYKQVRWKSKYIKNVEYKMLFWDKNLSWMLRKFGRELVKARDKLQSSATNIGVLNFNSRKSDLENPIDIMTEFFTYLCRENYNRKNKQCFADQIDLEGRDTGNREKDLIKLRNYIFISFKMDFQQILRDRDGIKRVEVQRERKWTRHKIQELSKEDIIATSSFSDEDDDDKSDALDLLYSTKSDALSQLIQNEEYEPFAEHRPSYDETTSDGYLMENWRNMMVKSQRERLEQLIKYIEEKGAIESIHIFDEITERLKQSEVAKIWYPHLDAESAGKMAHQFLKNIRKRVDKNLEEKFPDTYIKKEAKGLQPLSSNKNNISKNNNSTCLVYVPIEKDKSGIVQGLDNENRKDKQEFVLTQSDIDRMIGQYKTNLLRAIRNMDIILHEIEFGENVGLYQIYKGRKNPPLLPMTKEDMEYLKYGDPITELYGDYIGRLEIINKYFNPNNFKLKPSVYKLAKGIGVKEDESKYISHEELFKIRTNT